MFRTLVKASNRPIKRIKSIPLLARAYLTSDRDRSGAKRARGLGVGDEKLIRNLNRHTLTLGTVSFVVSKFIVLHPIGWHCVTGVNLEQYVDILRSVMRH